MQQVADFGAWSSPITASSVSSSGISFSEPQLHDGNLLWLESRPAEGGRQTIMQQQPNGQITELLPRSFSTHTKVHEYGGGCYAFAGQNIYFVNATDQQIYRLRDGQCSKLTSSPAIRFADLCPDPVRSRLYAVAEDHSQNDEPENLIVSIDMGKGIAEVTPVARGQDFYASPRVSPDGNKLVCLSWNHPHMPWHTSTLWSADIDNRGRVGEFSMIWGQEGVSLFQPHWSSSGQLHLVADSSGWWNLYRYQDGGLIPLVPMSADFGLPLWQLNMRTYGTLEKDELLATARNGKACHLFSITQKNVTPISHSFSAISQLWSSGREAAFVAHYPNRPSAIVRMNCDTGDFRQVTSSESSQPLHTDYISTARSISFPTANGSLVHGYFYPPRNPRFKAPTNKKPPLIVSVHGGPTSAVDASFDPKIQFWTSRGFAVIEVNYRGSSSYGRAYRESLKGEWGIADVEDCVAAANYLVERGEVDSNQLCIRGSSAGGYTTLAALTFYDTFKVGAVYYGIGDLEALAKETHKFESRYLDYLVGPWPESAALYAARSPIHHTHRLSVPTIFMQGKIDRVVPKEQAEAMVKVLTEKGIAVDYVSFPNEGHGFVSGDSIRTAIESEMAFYAKVLGFAPANTQQSPS